MVQLYTIEPYRLPIFRYHDRVVVKIIHFLDDSVV